MNIGAVLANSIYGKSTSTTVSNAMDKYVSKSKESISKRDSIEISSEAYAMLAEDEKLSATSGKDTLGISKGSEENTYVIHFSDSAMVSRAISRGYITVNGTRVDLSEEIMKQLSETDKQAEADRIQAFNKYVMEHDMAVAQQQSESWQKAAQDASKALEIAAKLSHGGKITSEEAQILMQFNPQMYAMAMSTGAMSKHHNQQDSGEKVDTKTNIEEASKGVEWSQFEWNTYETQMTVSIADKTEVQGVSECSVTLKEGK